MVARPGERNNSQNSTREGRRRRDVLLSSKRPPPDLNQNLASLFPNHRAAREHQKARRLHEMHLVQAALELARAPPSDAPWTLWALRCVVEHRVPGPAPGGA